MPLTISDQDQTGRADGSRFRVIVYLPRFVERLIEKPVRLLNRGT